MGIVIPPRYRPRSICCGICWTFQRRSEFDVDPVTWLCLEAGLAVIRLSIWAWNPTRDDAPPTRDYSRTEKVQTTSYLQQIQREILTITGLCLSPERETF